MDYTWGNLLGRVKSTLLIYIYIKPSFTFGKKERIYIYIPG